MTGKLRVGDKVRLLVKVEPYGSGYAGSPKVILPPGQEGIVGAVDCIPVCGKFTTGHFLER